MHLQLHDSPLMAIDFHRPRVTKCRSIFSSNDRTYTNHIVMIPFRCSVSANLYLHILHANQYQTLCLTLPAVPLISYTQNPPSSI